MKKLLLSDIIQPTVDGDSNSFARRAVAGDFEGLMDPVLAITHFETTSSVTGGYAQSGVSEIFYVFEDSAPYQATGESGEMIVTPGSLLWIKSGSKTHSESREQTGRRVEGIQLFLKSMHKNHDTTPLAIDRMEIPVIESEGVNVKILCGKTGQAISPVKMPQDLTILHISLEKEKDFRHTLPANWSGTLFALEGRFDVMASEETFELEEGMVISMGNSEQNESILFTGLTPSKLLFVSGLPVEKAQIQEDMFEKEPHFVPTGTHNLHKDANAN